MAKSKKEWTGIKSIGVEEKTIIRDKDERKEYRFYISSMKTDIDSFVRAVRGHWSAESMHWHLDVASKEDANHTLDKTAAQNHNIIRKWCLSILKPLELMNSNLSMKKKRFVISLSSVQFRNKCCLIKADYLPLRGRIIHAFGV
ncbi:MAG: ISAs1 family transposase [Clostridiales bacterium]|nr:ISAs1 family transposase [Clostridiales bacterium]